MIARIILSYILLVMTTYASPVTVNEIDSDAAAIQIAALKNENSLNNFIKENQNYDIYIKNSDNWKYVYIVNIPKYEKKLYLKAFRKYDKNIFFVNVKDSLLSKANQSRPTYDFSPFETPKPKNFDLSIFNTKKSSLSDKPKKKNNFVKQKSKQSTNIELKILKNYKKKEYLKSYQILKKTKLDKLNNPRLYFYFARSAFELKKYKEALKSYNRALKIDPDNIRTRLEKARTLFTLKQYSFAKEEFEAIQKMLTPPAVKTNIDLYLDTIQKQKLSTKAL